MQRIAAAGQSGKIPRNPIRRRGKFPKIRPHAVVTRDRAQNLAAHPASQAPSNEGIAASVAHPARGAPRIRQCPRLRAGRRARRGLGGPLVRVERAVPGDTQALGAVLSRQRHAQQDAHRDLARLRPLVSQILDRHRDRRASGRARAGRSVGQSGGADLLALVIDGPAIRSVPPGVELGGHVSDDGRHVRRGQALLHTSSCGGRGRTLE